MKNLTTAATLALSAVLLSAGAAHAAGTTGSSASAEIVAAVSISNNGGLNFGQIAPSAVIGTVTVAPNGDVSKSGGVTLGNGTTATASSFAVTGSIGNTYAITLPSSTLLTGPGVNLTVDGFESTPDAIGTLSGAGTDTLLVGATVHVGVSQAAGAYSGTFNVTVAYN